MSSPVSSCWRFTLYLEDETIEPNTAAEALRWAREADGGALSAKGESSDWAELEFDTGRSAVWYMRPDRVILRPHFPHRAIRNRHGERLFCEREEGFRLFAELLRGGDLPQAIPEERRDQPLLPGMEDLASELVKYRDVVWHTFSFVSDGRVDQFLRGGDGEWGEARV